MLFEEQLEHTPQNGQLTHVIQLTRSQGAFWGFVADMILTKQAIQEAWECGDIIIKPFNPSHLNPNSYNYRLSPTLLDFSQRPDINPPEHIELSEKGYLLQPGRLYLGATLELLGSRQYAMTLIGRSSLGRLGLFLTSAADLGHAGSVSHWTLELSVVQPLRIYPGMQIGQVSFWVQLGRKSRYSGRYHQDITPVPSRDFISHLQRGEH